MVPILRAVSETHVRNEKPGLRRLDGDLHADKRLDVIEMRPVSFTRQRNSLAGIPGPCRSPDPVDIIFYVLREVVVDDHF